MTIYFISDGEYIKIGYTNKENSDGRLKSLQTGNARELFSLCEIPGDRNIEKELHKKFKDIYVRGEWYKKDKKLVDYIRKYLKKDQLFTAVNIASMNNRNTKKELFTIVFRLDDDEVYVAQDYYPGGISGAMYDCVSCCMVDEYYYVPLSAVELETGKSFDKVRDFYQSVREKIKNFYFES